MERILVVDDSPDTLELIKRILKEQGYRIVTAGGVGEALEILGSSELDLIITDIKMPGADGFELLRHIKENYRDIGVLLVTGFPALEDAVKGIKIGAEEYLVKPFTDAELLNTVTQSLEKIRLRKKTAQVITDKEYYGLIGESPAIRNVYKSIDKAAAVPTTVLIQGESGTGKELVARAIHYSSPRVAGPFVPVNCGSIPEQLLESELFGHIKGAFTGAITSRAGFFQSAEKGTVFLDEISEASAAMQVKLLRVIQDKEIYMVGSSRPRKISVRIMAATNKDLLELIQKNNFREDLYYRLNVVTINVPPLRERGDDIYLLVAHFLNKFAHEMGREIPRISDEALRILGGYQWPGNVRELENMIQRLSAMVDGDIIDVPDLPSPMRYSASQSEDLTRTLAEVEAEYIQKVLRGVGGNKTKAASTLGIDRKTLRQKLDRK